MQYGPVFILGLHRCGTTLLYQLLGATGYFNVVTARHVAYFDDLFRPHRNREGFERRVAERFSLLGQADRGVDSVSIGPDTPEEYGFLLDRLTGSHVFSKSSIGALRSICDMIERDAGKQRTMLLKNPWDFGRADLIRRSIPDARFIFIHRNPFHVLSSTLRMVLEELERPNAYLSLLSDRYRDFSEGGFPWRVAQKLGNAAPGWVADWTIRSVAHRVADFLRRKTYSTRWPYPHIRYESLCSDANGVIGAALDRLGFPATDRDFAGRIGPSYSSVHGLILERRKRVVRLFGEYASIFGYDLDQISDGLMGDSPRHH